MAIDERDPGTVSMPLEVKRGRGRPRKPDALTPAERARRYRARRAANIRDATTNDDAEWLALRADLLALRAERDGLRRERVRLQAEVDMVRRRSLTYMELAGALVPRSGAVKRADALKLLDMIREIAFIRADSP